MKRHTDRDTTGGQAVATRRTKRLWAGLFVGLTTIVVAALSVAACSANSDSAAESMSMSSDAGGGAEAPSVMSSVAAQDSSESGDTASAGERPGAAVGPLPTGRQIIRTAEVTVTVEVQPAAGDTVASEKELDAAAADAARAVRALVTLPGGYVAGSDGRGSTITITLRIPAASYESVMDRLGGIGTVTDIAESTQDVTGQLVDVKSRITSQRASVDRLRALMAKAETIEDVISIESELTRREADLESLEQQQAQLSDAVALSTIAVTVDAVVAAADVTPEPPADHNAFVSGLLAGWHGLVTVARGAAVVLGGLLPFLIPLGAIALAGWLLVRRRRRRRAVTPTEAALPATAAADALDGRPDVHQVDEHADQRHQPQQ